MPTGLVSPHFSWSEVAHTTHGDLLDDNILYLETHPEAQAAVIKLATTIMEPIRAHFGAVSVHSWVRCPALNTRVKGNPRSQHMDGAACDFHTGAGVQATWDWIRLNLKVPWGQLILEPLGPGVDTWVHISLPGRGHLNEALR